MRSTGNGRAAKCPVMIVAMITGVSRGLGSALLARALLRFDAVVAIGRSLPHDIEPGSVIFIQADLADPSINWPSQLDRLDVLQDADEIAFFDNAAVLPLLDTGSKAFPNTLAEAAAVNVHSPVAISCTLLQIAKRGNKRLTLIHVGTGAANRPISGWGAYCATKAASQMFFKVLALDQPWVRVLICDPGLVDTDMQRQLREGERDLGSKPSMAGLVSPETAAAKIFERLDS